MGHMPFMPGSRCSEHGCTAMAEPGCKGRCKHHRPIGWYDRPSQHTLYVDEGRMRRIRKRLLAQHPVCECCEEARATEVDHIIPVAGGERSDLPYPPGWGMGSLYDDSNLQCLCHECHNAKSSAEREELRLYRQSVRRRKPPRRRRT